MRSRARTVALVTEEHFEAPDNAQPLVRNLLEDDAILVRALRARGFAPERVGWTRADVDWSTYDCAVIRTTWDYFERIDEFRAWVQSSAAATTLFNSGPTIAWNLDKRYLLDLESRGIPIVPTTMIEAGGDELQLDSRMAQDDTSRAVIKPAVSGGAWHTYKLERGATEPVEAALRDLHSTADLLLQPFVNSIETRGEVTLVMIDGVLTHAIRKVAAPGDFRVQDDHGGTVHAYQPNEAECALAEAAIAACDETPLYGRVDMVDGADGKPLVMELELIEPELWFRNEPTSADRLADALDRRLE